MKESRTFHAHINDDDRLVFNLQLIKIYPVRFTTDTAKMRTMALYLSWELRVESERVTIEPCISACTVLMAGLRSLRQIFFSGSNLYPRLICFLDALKIEY